MARDRRAGADAPAPTEDDEVQAEAAGDPPTVADPRAAADAPDDVRAHTPIADEEAEAADQAVAEAIARYSSRPRTAGVRDPAVRHASHESMAAIEKFLGLARAAGNPGRESVWVGRVLKRRVKAWQLVYDFDADFAYVARMDRGIYLTTKGKLLFTVGDSRALRRRVAWKTSYRSLDTFMARFADEHEVMKVPMLHHRRLLEGIARICAQQRLDWR